MSAMLQFEEQILIAAEQGDSIGPAATAFRKVCLKIEEDARQGVLSLEELRQFSEQVARIKHIALYFAALAEVGDNELGRAKADALSLMGQAILSTSVSVKTTRCKDSEEEEACQKISTQETLHSKTLRRWFLDNIADPFPSKETKKDLVEKTNAFATTASSVSSNPKVDAVEHKEPMDLQQCSLWFINSRRRSHWTDFFRCFAQSDKELMRCFMDCLRREEDAKKSRDDTELRTLLQRSEDATKETGMQRKIDDCREQYTFMMNWLRQISNEPVGDWMDEVIREAKEEVKQDKIARRSERKRAAEERQRLEEERAAQKAKKREVSSKRRRKAVRERQASETQKRKTEREKRAVRRMPLRECHTPDNTLMKPQITGSSTGSSTYAEQYPTRRVPSLVESSDGGQPHHWSSSSSSLASYDNFLHVPSSPTLGILTNGNQPEAKSLSVSPTSLPLYPLAREAVSLYADLSRTISTLRTSANDHTQQQVLSSNEHIEEQLSGGSRSISSRQPSPAVHEVEQRSRSTSAAAPILHNEQDNSAIKSDLKSVGPRLTI